MNNVIRFSPAAELRRFQREIENLFEMTPLENDDTVLWAPRLDLSETADAYHFGFDVPGLTREELDIQLHDGMLTVRGERKSETRDEKQNYLVAERRYGKFSRSITLPKDVDVNRIEASYKEGVLNVRIPKAEESKPRRIEININ